MYRATLAPRAGAALSPVPVWELALVERRGGGWSAAVELRSDVSRAGDAFDAALGAGFAPGRLCTVVVEAGQHVARHWTCVVSALSAHEPSYGERYASCTVALADPFGVLAARSLHRAWAGCSVGALVGGAAGAGAGGAGEPTLRPVLGRGGDVELRENVRGVVAALPWAIAWSVPLGAWLDALCAALALRIEMRTGGDGAVIATLTDVLPAESPLNARGPLRMHASHEAAPGLRSMRLARMRTRCAPPDRGFVLDAFGSGSPRRVADSVSVSALFSVPGFDAANAADIARRGALRDAAAQLRVEALSTQPGLVPGRTVVFVDDHGAQDTRALFGARLWHAGEVAHLYRGGAYVNRTELEKAGASWFPSPPCAGNAQSMVSALIGTGDEAQGGRVEPDRLGRVPVRVPAGAPEAVIALAAVAPMAGARHGTLVAYRVGDLCRVRVHGPLSAEIAGLVHRDDRSVSGPVAGSRAAFATEYGPDLWRGMAFGSVGP